MGEGAHLADHGEDGREGGGGGWEEGDMKDGGGVDDGVDGGEGVVRWVVLPVSRALVVTI